MPHATGITVSCCESGFDRVHLPALLPAQNDPSSPQLGLCTCVCPHCFSSTFGIWTSSDCQQLQSTSTRGEPLEKAWKEPVGDSNSPWPKLVEHRLCHNSSHSSLKSCLQTQNALSGKSADLCSPNNALLLFLVLLKTDTLLFATQNKSSGQFFHSGCKNKFNNTYIFLWLILHRELPFTNFRLLTICCAPQ